MAVELATAYISLLPSTKGIKAAIEKEFDGVAPAAKRSGDEAGQGFLGGIRNHIGKVAALVGGAFAVTKGIGLLKDSVGAASDLGESLSKVNVVFEDGAPAIVDWSKNAAEAMGQSQQQALEAAGTYGNLFRSMGIGTKQSTDMSQSLVGLAADLASFNNVSPDDALLALRSGLSGETEPLKRFGINLNEATLKAKAMELGLSDGKGTLDANAKAQAAYALIMEQSTLAQGDFARTSDGLANKQRILSARFEDIKAKIGGALIPVVTSLTGALTDKLFPAFDAVTKAIAPFFRTLRTGMTEDEGTPLEKVALVVRDAFGQIVDAGKRIIDVLRSIDWVGVFTTAKNAITPVLEAVLSIANDGFRILKDVVMGAAGFLQDHWDLIKGIASTIKDVLTKAVQVVAAVFGFLADHMDAVKAVAIPLIAAFVTYKATVTTISAVTKTVTAVTKAWTAVQAAFNAVMAVNPAILVTVAIVALVAAVIYAYTHFESFRNIIDAIGRAFATAGRAIVDGIKAAVDWLINTAIPAIGDFLGGVKDKIGEAIEWVKGIPGHIKDALAGALDWLYQIGVDVIQGMRNGLDAAWGAVTGFVGNIFGAITGALSDAASWLVDIGKKIISGLKAGIDWYWNTYVVGFWGGMASRVLGFLTGAVNWLYQIGVDILQGLLNGYEAMWRTGITAALNIGSRIKGMVTGATTWLYGVGEDIIRGLRDGIVNSWHWITDKLSDLAGRLPGPIKKILGIGSPSKVFRELGMWTMEGFRLGVAGEERNVVGAVSHVGDRLAAVDMAGPSYRPSTFGPIQAGTQPGTVPAAGGGVTVLVTNPAPRPREIGEAVAWSFKTLGR